MDIDDTNSACTSTPMSVDDPSALPNDDNSNEDADGQIYCFFARKYPTVIHDGKLLSASKDPIQYNEACRVHSKYVKEMNLKRQIVNGGCGKVFYGKMNDTKNSNGEQSYVIKMINCTQEDQVERMINIATQEFQILTLLAEKSSDDEENNKLLCMPLEMWHTPRQLNIVFPKRPMDLFNYLDERKKKGVNLTDTGRILQQTLRAAAHLHNKFDIIHNDIKPENILIDPKTLQCWLTDFGGSHLKEQTKRDPRDVVTFTYTSPERLQWNSDYDERSDSWSLGMLAAELVYGRDLLDSLVSAARWRKIVLQNPTTKIEYLCEFLDEPGVLDKLAPPSKCIKNKRCNGLRHFLCATLSFHPYNRLSATELLQKNEPISHFLAKK